MNTSWKEELVNIKQSLLTGVSFMIPFVVAGGILIAFGFALGGIFVFNTTGFAADLFAWGKIAFGLMIPVLGGYIAFSLADKPGIAAGFVAGMIANNQGSGFLGAMVGGIAAGYIVRLLKKIKLPRALQALLPTLIIPLVSITAIGIVMTYVLGGPVTWLNVTMSETLAGLEGGSLIVLGIIQGAMLAFDMGGPVNKAAYAFALAASATGNWGPMAANFIASMTPPMGIAIAILLSKKRFNKAERSSASGCVVGGFGMITEFAIPYAVKDPARVIPSLMVGSATGAVLSYLAGLSITAPHGGLFVFFLANKPVLFLVILFVASCVTAGMLILLKKPLSAEEYEAE